MKRILTFQLLAGLSLIALSAAEIFIYQPIEQVPLIRERRQAAPHLNVHGAPKTSFSCEGRMNGEYYADPETRCQAYHICLNGVGGKLSAMTFVCPNGTIFSQNSRVCNTYEKVYCNIQDRFYESLHGDINQRRTDYAAPDFYSNVKYPDLPVARRPSNDISEEDEDLEEGPRTQPPPPPPSSRRRNQQRRPSPPATTAAPPPPRRQSNFRNVQAAPVEDETPSPVRNSAPSQRRPVFRNTVSRGVTTTTEAPETTTVNRRSRIPPRVVPQPPPVDLSIPEGVYLPPGASPLPTRLPPGLRAARPVIVETPAGGNEPFTLPTLPPASGPIRPPFQPNLSRPAGRPVGIVTRQPATDPPTTLPPTTQPPTTRAPAPAIVPLAPGGVNSEYDYAYDYDYPAAAAPSRT